MADPLEHLRAALADRYALGTEIGRGGMATVYAAEDLRHHRNVAIKILHPELTAAVGSDRFAREIEIAARLSHPHIVPLFDSGEVAGTLYYVMPLLTEGSLRSRLDREKQLPLAEADRVVREVAAALDSAHEAGVIHRDIKPANIMFSGGQAVVADFGVATAVAAAESDVLTATGLAVGTSHYMSPEQGAGVQDVDARSDVFALGCIAYEVLAGSRPFDGPTPQAIQARKMAGDVPSLRVVREAVPDAAEQSIRTALSPTPADRHSTAGDFAAALGAAIRFPTGDAHPAEAAGSVTRRPRSRLLTIVGATATALAIWHFGLGGLPGTVRPAAASFFQERDRVVVRDFENRTADGPLGLAMRQAVITDLHQSPHVSVVDYAELGHVFRRMQVPDTSRLTPQTALEVARREGYPAVIGGGISPLGTGFLLTAEIVEASTGEVVVRVRETAEDEREVLPAVERLSRLLRRHLGESLLSLRRSRPLPDVTSASLEALESFAQALEYARAGDAAASLPLLERAVSIDTGFAAAYRAMAIHHANRGRMVQAGSAIERAYALSGRLPDRERYLTGAVFHRQSGNADSAAYKYELLLELEPEHPSAINNLGDLYEGMGRYEDALEMYRRSLVLDPQLATPHFNLMSAARTLGLHGLADSVAALTQERFPGSMYAIAGTGLNAYYAGDFEAGEPYARLLVERYPGYAAGNAQRILASSEASRGHIRHAMALADSAGVSYTADGAAFMTAISLVNKTVVAWVGGQASGMGPELDQALAAPEVGAVRWEHARLSFVALGYALGGYSTKAEELLPRLDSLSASGATFPIEDLVRAVLSLAAGRPEESLNHLQQGQALDYGIDRVLGRFLAGDAYAALGRQDEAVAKYEGLLSSYGVHWRDADQWASLLPLAHERLGENYLAMADTARAIEHLLAFSRMWQEADLELQPRVAAAREKARLLSSRDH
jgi:tetratricopeptide (TPR) repeat protein/tRNA A-37 threonylcarbamoyl transferase component Bud32